MIGQSFHSAIRHNGALNQAVFCQDSSANLPRVAVNRSRPRIAHRLPPFSRLSAASGLECDPPVTGPMDSQRLWPDRAEKP
jgi:hypothetical protein